MTREEWLERAADILGGLFADKGYDVPSVRVSTGWPSGVRKNGGSNTIGQCWHPEAAVDGVSQIFISPILFDSSRVADVLAHEMIHAILPGAKHGPKFKKCALAIGLTGKMTATVAGHELAAWIERNVVAKLGAYPHAPIKPGVLLKPKQSTRLLKVTCEGCGYVARTTKQWLETIGAPICPCNGEAMEVPA